MINQQRAFSLVELLISSLIIGFLCSLLFLQWMQFYQTSMIEQETSEIQENTRFAISILQRFIESSGLIGLRRWTPDFPIFDLRNRTEDDPLDAHQHMRIIHLISDSHRPSILKKRGIHPKIDSDILIVRSMEAVTNSPLDYINDPWMLNTKPLFYPQEDIVIANEHQAVFATIKKCTSNAQGQYLEISPSSLEKLGSLWTPFTEIGRLQTFIFYIAPTDRCDQKGHPIDALYWMDGLNHQAELIPNISRMMITCLEKNSPHFTYLTNEIIWENIIAIKINLTLSKNMRTSTKMFSPSIISVIIPLREHFE